jgi:hypothetical protein
VTTPESVRNDQVALAVVVEIARVHGDGGSRQVVDGGRSRKSDPAGSVHTAEPGTAGNEQSAQEGEQELAWHA